MLHLPNEVLLHILHMYYEIIKCKKNKKELNKINICKKMYDYNKNNNYFKCNILYINNINLKICNIHDNVSLDFVDKLIKQINHVKNNTMGIIYHNKSSNDLLDYNNLEFIHCDDLKKNEKIVKIILKKYNYKLMNYCCGGNGCRISKINQNN